MLTLRKTSASFGLDLGEIDEAPPPAAHEVTVAVEAAGICGSDVHAYEWTDGYGFMVPHLPVVMGHEFAGIVVKAGAASGVREGARVTVMPGIQCGVCANCLRDDQRNCLNRASIGPLVTLTSPALAHWVTRTNAKATIKHRVQRRTIMGVAPGRFLIRLVQVHKVAGIAAERLATPGSRGARCRARR